MIEFEKVLSTPELGPGAIAEVEAQGRTLALTNVGQQYFAVDAVCPEDGTNLARDGRIEGDHLVCPGDQAVFDLRTGIRLDADSEHTLQRYSIRIQENSILIGPPLEGQETSGGRMPREF
jgi:3-phenylpropionate/trans-cinnamate dioxygenase ferredoxin component